MIRFMIVVMNSVLFAALIAAAIFIVANMIPYFWALGGINFIMGLQVTFILTLLPLSVASLPAEIILEEISN